MLLLFLCPFTEGKVKAPSALPPQPLPPPEFWATLMGLIPGTSVRSCVKFRPFKGRSLTGFVSITVPSSDVVESRDDRFATTVVVADDDPTRRTRSMVT